LPVSMITFSLRLEPQPNPRQFRYTPALVRRARAILAHSNAALPLSAGDSSRSFILGQPVAPLDCQREAVVGVNTVGDRGGRHSGPVTPPLPH